MTMKKTIIILSAILFSGTAFAQGAADALLISQTSYEGTARSMAMGNAFTALGGDLGAISINPAGSGVYRCNEFSFSPSFVFAGGNTTYDGNPGYGKDTRFALSNIGFVNVSETGRTSGVLNWNFGFTFNRTNSLNNYINASGRNSNASILGSIASGLRGVDQQLLEQSDDYEPYNNASLPWNAILAYDCWLIDPETDAAGNIINGGYVGATENYANDGSIGVGGTLKQDYSSHTYGGVNEITFNFGANYNDFLYFGGNINFSTVDYTINDYYSEHAVRSSDFEDGFVAMTNSYWQNTSGAGINVKFGAICTPIAGLRLGATFTTPTWYSLTDSWQRSMTSSFDNGNYYEQNSPVGSYDYKVTAPMRWSLGAAYTFGGFGLVSLDYEGVDYSGIKMADYNGNRSSFNDENYRIGRGFGYSSIIRAGAEFRFCSFASLRAGYNHYGTPGSLVDDNSREVYKYASTNLISGGVGFRFGEDGRTSFDVAYQRMLCPVHQTFYAFDSYDGIKAPVIGYDKNLSKLVFTIAWRF